MRKRLLTGLSPTSSCSPSSCCRGPQADNDGRGFYGATNDKGVTNFGFALIIFFPLFVFLMSMLQRHLDKRKEARKAGHSSQLGDARWRGGW